MSQGDSHSAENLVIKDRVKQDGPGVGTSGPADISRRLTAVRGGSDSAVGELFENCRNYLLLIANAAVKKGLQPKVGASDLVQETFTEAYRILDRFQGETEEELLRWLTCILEHKIGNAWKRYFGSAKRDVRREVEWQWLWGNASLNNLQESNGKSPSEILAAKEYHERFQKGLNQLSADHQTVIRLRVQQDLPFEDVGRQMDRSAAAAQRLFIRAVMQLKILLANDNHQRC